MALQNYFLGLKLVYMLMEEIVILVVDDVNAMRIQIKELLLHFGFKKVHIAGHGEEAKLVLERETVHLILADWLMEPTDGLQLLKFIRAHPKFKEIAFLMVTAENTREKVILAVQSGIDDYLIKPLTPQQIQTKVIQALQKKKVL